MDMQIVAISSPYNARLAMKDEPTDRAPLVQKWVKTSKALPTSALSMARAYKRSFRLKSAMESSGKGEVLLGWSTWDLKKPKTLSPGTQELLVGRAMVSIMVNITKST